MHLHHSGRICSDDIMCLSTGEMAMTGDQWAIFLFHSYTYDPEDPWNGLFQSTILVSVCPSSHDTNIF
jgi:hypothetical protein